MKTNRILGAIIAVMIFSLVVISCQKEETDNYLATSAEMDAAAESMYDDVMDQAENGLSSAKDATIACVVRTVTHPNGTKFPRVITLDFGSGCEGYFGRVRKGKIVITETDTFSVVGAQRIINLDSFYVDNVKIEGTKTITYKGLNGNSQPYHEIVLVNGKIIRPDGSFITRAANRTRTIIEGAANFNVWDNVYEITGTASGTTWRGNTYTVTIVTPLNAAAACRFIRSGSKEIVIGDKTILIDYGTGECDNIATVTIDGKTETIQLKH